MGQIITAIGLNAVQFLEDTKIWTRCNNYHHVVLDFAYVIIDETMELIHQWRHFRTIVEICLRPFNFQLLVPVTSMCVVCVTGGPYSQLHDFQGCQIFLKSWRQSCANSSPKSSNLHCSYAAQK